MSVPEVQKSTFSQLVTFTMAGEEYSFPINSVQEIVRLPEVTPVPGAPPSVSGVINLRGSILPLVDLRSHFSLKSPPDDDDTRVVIVRHQGGTTGMVVDRVNEVLQLGENVVTPPDLLPTVQTEGLLGIAKINGGKRVIMILSEEELLPNPSPVDLPEIPGQTDATGTAPRRTLEAEEHLVTFLSGGEEYALSIHNIREIVRYSELTEISDSPDYFLGILSLRNHLIPVVSLQILVGQNFPSSAEKTDSWRIIIADINGTTTGLLVDAVSEVTRIPKSAIDPPPETLSGRQNSYIRGIGKIDDGARLLILLDPDHLLARTEQKNISAPAGCQVPEKETAMKEENYMGDEKQIVCFRLADEEYGVDIMQVCEIIRIDTITTVPGSPPYVKGIVNLRGNVLPVIDLRRRLGLREDARHEQNRILVVETAGRTAGLIVDAVNEVLRIPETYIEPPPAAVEFAAEDIEITGIGKLDNGERTIILMDTESLLTKGKTNEKDENEQHASPAGQSLGGGNNDDAGRNDSLGLIDEVARAIEEVEKPPSKQSAGEPSLQELMSLKKDQLLDKAEHIGAKVDKRMTKKQIAEEIIKITGHPS